MKNFVFGALLFASSLMAFAGNVKMADPTIFYEDGYFYLTGTNRTGSGFNMYRSTDLVHWKACGNATGGLALWKEDTFGSSNFWAPQLFKHGGKYYFAYAAEEQIGIAVSDSPMGPFKQSNIHCLKNTTKQIDPFLFRDDDGTIYLYYVRLDGSNSLYVARMKDDLSDLAEEPKFCLRPADSGWEHTKNYTTYKVSEGPTVVKDGDYYFLLYSCNDFHDIDYAVGYAYSKSPLGPWTKSGKPFLTRHNTGMNGSGHGDLFQDANGQWYYVFHVHESNTNLGTRRTAIVPITLTSELKNKFVPDCSRIILCDDAAASGATFPAAGTEFEVDDIRYRPTTGSYVKVISKDPVAFNSYKGEIVIPSKVKNGARTYTVNAIGSGAFHNCTLLNTVVLPNTVTQLEDFAFEGASLRDITLPSSCKVGNRTFALCEKLRDVVVKAQTPSTLAEDAFSSTAYSKAKLWVPTGRHTTYSKTSAWSNFAHISGMEAAQPTYSFKVNGFFYNLLDADRLALAEESAFHFSYNSPTLVVPDSVTYDNHTYAVTQVAKSAVRDCHFVESVVLPSPIDTIQTYAFSSDYRLKSAELPATLRYIAGSAFANCAVLDSIVCHAVVPPVLASKSVFATSTYDGVLVVPEGAKAAYEAHDVWKYFSRIEEMTSTAVEALTSSTSADTNHGFYTLDGKLAGTSLAPLRRGIYIHKGKKIVR